MAFPTNVPTTISEVVYNIVPTREGEDIFASTIYIDDDGQRIITSTIQLPPHKVKKPSQKIK
jgi:hypothetical protein